MRKLLNLVSLYLTKDRERHYLKIKRILNWEKINEKEKNRIDNKIFWK